MKVHLRRRYNWHEHSCRRLVKQGVEVVVFEKDLLIQKAVLQEVAEVLESITLLNKHTDEQTAI